MADLLRVPVQILAYAAMAVFLGYSVPGFVACLILGMFASSL